MTRRTVRLVEQRSRVVRLPSEDIRFLLAHARHLVDVVPTFRRQVCRITARGVIGWFDGPTCRFAIRPKVPWPTVRMLLGLTHSAQASETAPELETGLLDLLAKEFVARFRAVEQAGLVPGYHDRETAAAFLRGKLRAVDQLRDSAARAFPDRFQLTENVLDLDTPWNRIPRAIAEQLLAGPDLGLAARAELRDAIVPLHDIPLAPVTDADFAGAESEVRAAHYRPLLALCRLLHDGFAAARLTCAGAGAFLIDLSRAFERYLAEALAAELARRPAWSLESQPVFPVGPTPLQPDMLIRKAGAPRCVLDAKWKVPGAAPDAADLHQVLAYSAVTGAKQVGLVYPGRLFARRAFAVPGQDVRVSLFRVQVIGTTDECASSMVRLTRAVRRENR